MKNSYIERAKKFISQVYPYIKDWKTLPDVERAIENFNNDKHRKVQVDSGCTRCVLITSDYVVKFDFEVNSYWGNCHEELNAWRLIQEAYLDKVEFFAPIELFQYEEMDFYLMPYIRGVGNSRTWSLLNTCYEDVYLWFCRNMKDVHEFNFGIKNNIPVCIDYASFVF